MQLSKNVLFLPLLPHVMAKIACVPSLLSESVLLDYIPSNRDFVFLASRAAVEFFRMSIFKHRKDVSIGSVAPEAVGKKNSETGVKKITAVVTQTLCTAGRHQTGLRNMFVWNLGEPKGDVGSCLENNL